MSCSICGEVDDIMMKCVKCGRNFCEYCGNDEKKLCKDCLKIIRAESKI